MLSSLVLVTSPLLISLIPVYLNINPPLPLLSHALSSLFSRALSPFVCLVITCTDLGLLSEQERDEEALVLYERVLGGYELLTTSTDINQSVEPRSSGDADGDGDGVIGNSDVNSDVNTSEASPSSHLPPPSLPHLAAMVNVAVTWKKLGLHLTQTRDMFERALRGYELTPSIGRYLPCPYPPAIIPPQL